MFGRCILSAAMAGHALPGWSPDQLFARPFPPLQSPLTSTTLDDGSSMNATKHIVAVARRAQQLLKQQQEIERQVEQR